MDFDPYHKLLVIRLLSLIAYPSFTIIVCLGICTYFFCCVSLVSCLLCMVNVWVCVVGFQIVAGASIFEDPFEPGTP